MDKRHHNDEDMITQQLDSLQRQQDHLDRQIRIIIRLLQGDSTLNTLRPTGLVNDFKEMDKRLESMQNNTAELLEWWTDRNKRKYIINVDLVQWGKVIAWVVGIIGGILGLMKWLAGK